MATVTYHILVRSLATHFGEFDSARPGRWRTGSADAAHALCAGPSERRMRRPLPWLKLDVTLPHEKEHVVDGRDRVVELGG